MALDSSPKKWAEDVASGLVSVNRIMLKRYSPIELQRMMDGLNVIFRENRTLKIESGDHKALQDKGARQGKLMGALRTLRTYAKKEKLQIRG